MPDEKDHKPRRERQFQDWITSFDRDLIRASIAKTEISFETIDDDQPIVGAYVLQVDKDFIKVRLNGDGGEEAWFNKQHIFRVVIGR